MSWDLSDLRYCLGEDDDVAAKAVLEAADACRHAIAHLAPELRSQALAAALADEVGEPTPHRWSMIGTGAFQHIIGYHPECELVRKGAAKAAPAELQGRLFWFE